MTKKHILTAIFSIAALVAPLSGVKAEAANVQDSNWTVFTSFDAFPWKIIDSERYTYFLVHQNMYSPGTFEDTYENPLGSILYYDKLDGRNVIKALNQKVSLSGVEIRTASYNPDGKYLLIVYMDGGIDMVTDSGEVHTIDRFRNPRAPFSMETMHISFPLGTSDAWIATNSGYIHIDGASFQVANARILNQRLRAICPVGDKVMAIVEAVNIASNGTVTVTGRNIYESTTKEIISFDDFKDTGISSKELDVIMPVNDTEFVSVDGNNICRITRKADGSLSKSVIVTDNTLKGQLALGANKPGNGVQRNDRAYLWSDNENNFLVAKDGYLVFSKTTAYKIPRGAVVGDVIQRHNFATSYPVWVGTSDFSNYWFYDSRRGFYRSTASGDGANTSWIAQDPVEYDGPVAFERAKLCYSPKYGMMVFNDYTTREGKKGGGFDRTLPLHISGYKGGKWTNYSPVYHMPEVCEDNADLKRTWETNRQTYYAYPLNNPMGGIIDASNPDYMVFSSVWDGICAVNLGNVKGQIMRFTSPKTSTEENVLAKFGGKKVVLPNAGWGTFSQTLPLGTDTDGTMWFYYNNGFGYVDNNKNIFPVIFWTQDSRNPAADAQDVSKSGDWGICKYELPIPINTFSNLGTVLRHPSNKNKLAIAARGDVNYYIVVVDHNGTPGDTSDDKVDLIKCIESDEGKTTDLTTDFKFVKEDERTGLLYVGNENNIFVIDLSKPVENGAAQGDGLSLLHEDGTRTYPATTKMTEGLTFDEYNRLWFSARGEGVIGISSDRKEIFATYSTENSPLPSTNITDLCWNPETKELMIVTDKGLAAVKPDAPLPEGSGSSLNPYVYPETVAPGSATYVTLYNAPDRASVDVYGADGNKVCSLTRQNGLFMWDVCDKDGKLVPEGVYTFKDQSQTMQPIKVNVLR